MSDDPILAKLLALNGCMIEIHDKKTRKTVCFGMCEAVEARYAHGRPPKWILDIREIRPDQIDTFVNHYDMTAETMTGIDIIKLEGRRVEI